MQIKFKKLHSDAKIPFKANPGDAGYDLIATTKVGVTEVLEKSGRAITKTMFKYFQMGTGLALELPEGYVGLLFPRSSISETSMELCNNVGVLDSGYRNEITFRFRANQNGLRQYDIGDKIGQLIIVKLPEIELIESEELSESIRGLKGYGSSGR